MKNYPHKEFLLENQVEVEELPKLLQKRIVGFDEMLEDMDHTIDEDRNEIQEFIDTLSLEILEDLQDEFEDRLENNEFSVTDEQYHEVVKATYKRLLKLIPNLKGWLKEEIKNLNYSGIHGNLDYQLTNKIKEDQYEVKLELIDDNGQIQPGVEFEIEINSSEKTAVAVQRRLNSYYMALYADDGEIWSDLPQDELYFLMSQSLIKWLDGLIDNKITLELPKIEETEMEPCDQENNLEEANQKAAKSDDEKILDQLWKSGRVKKLKRSFLKELGIKANIDGNKVRIGNYTLLRVAVFSYTYNLEKLSQ